MAKNNVFIKAKQYKKKHPNVAWSECIKRVSGKAVGAKKKTAKKKTAAKSKGISVRKTRVRKVTNPVNIKIGASIAEDLRRVSRKLTDCQIAYSRLKDVSIKGMSANEKKQLALEKARTRKYIAELKKEQTELTKLL